MDGAPPRANSKERKGRYGLVCAACDGWDEHDLVAVLEGVGFTAEEPDVLVVDVDVDEAAELAVVTFDLGGKRGECLVDVSQKAGEVPAAESKCLRPSVW